MTIRETLGDGMKQLKHVSASYQLDGELLLAFVIGKSKEYLFAHPNNTLSARNFRKYQTLVRSRARHEPVAYLIGEKEFYGLSFFVNKHVLIPRPETEILVESALKVLSVNPAHQPYIIDVGCGSGAISIAIVKHSPTPLHIIASDISTKALSIAKINIKRHGVSKNITLVKGDLLAPFLSKRQRVATDQIIITANLPYLSSKLYKNAPIDVRLFEPHTALLGGKDGLMYYRKLFTQLERLIKCFSFRQLDVFCEFSPEQTHPLSKIIRDILHDAKLCVEKDLCGKNRMIHVQVINPNYS